MLDRGGEETERGAQCPLGVSKSAESGLVPDLKETLADMQSLPAFQTTRHTHRHQSSLSPNTNTYAHGHMFTHIENPSDSVSHTHTHTHTHTHRHVGRAKESERLVMCLPWDPPYNPAVGDQQSVWSLSLEQPEAYSSLIQPCVSQMGRAVSLGRLTHATFYYRGLSP